jgi:hypothetical protein
LSYFRKHWPSNLVSDVKDTIHVRVSPLSHLSYCYLIYIAPQFLERFHVLESSLSIKATTIRKAAPLSLKSSHTNIDDTETEDDSDSCEAAVGESNASDEWKTYLNSVEDVPDELGVIRWWGVSRFSSVRAYH